MTGSLLVGGQRASAQAVASIDDKPSKEIARVEFSDLQQQTLLAEANKSYNTALEKVQSDSAEAKQGFADAAGKYQLLVERRRFQQLACISTSPMRISRAASPAGPLPTIFAVCELNRRCVKRK